MQELTCKHKLCSLVPVSCPDSTALRLEG